MKILQAVGELVFFGLCVLNISGWLWNRCRLPRYVHWIALAAFGLGGVTSYEILALGNSMASALWVAFLGAGIVYVVFILHGAGLPEEKQGKPEEWRK